MKNQYNKALLLWKSLEQHNILREVFPYMMIGDYSAKGVTVCVCDSFSSGKDFFSFSCASLDIALHNLRTRKYLNQYYRNKNALSFKDTLHHHS